MSDPNLMQLATEFGEVKASYKAMHKRQDEMEERIEKKLDKMDATLDELVAKENRRTGWIAAMVFIGSLISGIITYIVKG